MSVVRTSARRRLLWSTVALFGLVLLLTVPGASGRTLAGTPRPRAAHRPRLTQARCASARRSRRAASSHERRRLAACRRRELRRRHHRPRPTTRSTTATSPGTATTTPTSSDPLAGDRFYVDPSDSANLAVQSLQAGGQGAEADQLEAIASQPQAIWLTDDASAGTVAGVLAAANAAHQVPIFAVYNLPGRDCGSYSAGGASSAADYDSFIDTIVAGLGQSKAVLILEPDALSETCMPAGTDELIANAVTQLDTDRQASVYVDAGNPGWQTAATEAAALSSVIGNGRAGFAVNVSNYYSTSADVTYGSAISALLGGRHFVIDTSRNGGNVAAGQWCNPSGAALGPAPTADTGDSLLDAELWIKSPGESDGTCNGGPSAGQFWLSDALSLVAG